MIEKLTSDKALMESFQKDPIKTIETMLGVELPEEVVGQIKNAVAAKLASEKFSGLTNAFKNMF